MILKTFQRLQGNTGFVEIYLDCLSKLFRTGLFDFLREKGRIVVAFNDSPTEIATKGAYSAGYNDALDDILNFKELYLDPITDKKISPDFGGVSAAIKAGDLLPEDIKKLKGGV